MDQILFPKGAKEFLLGQAGFNFVPNSKDLWWWE